jgi:hypothetical protein
MEKKETFGIVLVESVSHALHAEKMLIRADIPCKLIPVPRHLSSDCGVCLRVRRSDKECIENVLTGKLDVFSIIIA